MIANIYWVLSMVYTLWLLSSPKQFNPPIILWLFISPFKNLSNLPKVTQLANHRTEIPTRGFKLQSLSIICTFKSMELNRESRHWHKQRNLDFIRCRIVHHWMIIQYLRVRHPGSHLETKLDHCPLFTPKYFSNVIKSLKRKLKKVRVNDRCWGKDTGCLPCVCVCVLVCVCACACTSLDLPGIHHRCYLTPLSLTIRSSYT